MRALWTLVCLLPAAASGPALSSLSLAVCGAGVAPGDALARACGEAAPGPLIDLRWPRRNEDWDAWWSALGRTPGAWVRAPAGEGGPIPYPRLRFALYLALLGGGRGLLLDAPASAPMDSPEYRLGPQRLTREIDLLRPILRDGRREALPFSLEPGLEALLVSYRGRSYLLIANHAGAEVAWPTVLGGPAWRALFELRKHPLELLSKRDSRHLLPPGRVLLLEKRGR